MAPSSTPNALPSSHDELELFELDPTIVHLLEPTCGEFVVLVARFSRTREPAPFDCEICGCVFVPCAGFSGRGNLLNSALRFGAKFLTRSRSCEDLLISGVRVDAWKFAARTRETCSFRLRRFLRARALPGRCGVLARFPRRYSRVWRLGCGVRAPALLGSADAAGRALRKKIQRRRGASFRRSFIARSRSRVSSAGERHSQRKVFSDATLSHAQKLHDSAPLREKSGEPRQVSVTEIGSRAAFCSGDLRPARGPRRRRGRGAWNWSDRGFRGQRWRGGGRDGDG